MKRQNSGDLPNQPPLKKQNMRDGEYFNLQEALETDSISPTPDTSDGKMTELTVPIPDDIICNHLVPHYSRTWLFVSKRHHGIAFANLAHDPRLQKIFSSIEEALISACKAGNTLAVQTLLRHGHINYLLVTENYDGEEYTYLDMNDLSLSIFERNNYAIIQSFINDKRTPSKLLGEIMCWAVTKGHYEMAVSLLSDRTRMAEEIKFSIKQLLNTATSHGYINLVQYILREHREFFGPFEEQALQYAANDGNYMIVDELINYGFDPTENCNYPLRMATYKNHYEIVKRLLQCPQVDPNDARVYDFDGDSFVGSAVETALYSGDIGIIQLILADPRTILTPDLRRLFAHLLPGQTIN